jgi:hypothetical protein
LELLTSGPTNAVSSRSIYPGVNTITVDSIDHGGNVSQPVTYDFYLATPPPAADKTMNGDGIPDVVTVGDTAGLGPGLWLATGKRKGSVAAEIGQLRAPARCTCGPE